MARRSDPADDAMAALIRRVLRALAAFVIVLGFGTTGYVALGQGRWSWADSLYMSVITLSTVGYGEILAGMDAVPGARGFTMALILLGSGVLLYATSALTAFVVEGDLRGVLRRRAMEREIDGMSGHVILCGLGSTGGHVAEELAANGTPFVAVDLHPEKLDRVHLEHGLRPLFLRGDATEESVLVRAGIHRAVGLIAALTDDRDNLFLTFSARMVNPNLRIVAKAVEPDNEAKIRRAGADDVINPTWLGGVRMVGAMLNPAVVRFMDDMLRDRRDPHRVEEFRIGASSPLAGRTLREADLRRFGDALVIATRDSDGSLRYNPDGDTRLDVGLTLLVFARAKDWAALAAAVSGERMV